MSDLWRLSAVEVASRVRAGDLSASEVTGDVLERLSAVNPAINAVVQEMPDEALDAARRVDEAVAAGQDPGPLAGVPVTVKVNADQAGHATTNGLRLQRDLVATEDNPVVANLRKAGAVIVGRTNTPAFSLHWFTRNSLHGHTRNPRNLALTPGGSSGGAASAVAAGIGAVGHSSDIAGSIRYPAYACGVQGLRPTVGRVPAMNPTSGPDRHIGPQLMAVSGPIARTVADVRAAYLAMAAEDRRDPAWTPVPPELPPGAKRVAVSLGPADWPVAPEVAAAVHGAADLLAADGFEVVEVECPPLREAAQLQAALWLAEFRRGGKALVEQEGDPDALFVAAQMDARCPTTTLESLVDLFPTRSRLMREWQQLLDECSVLLCPVSAELPFPDLLIVESPESFERVMEAQLLQIALPLLGMPAMTVSTGMTGDMPNGVQLVAGRWQEARLFRAAEVIERGSGVPVPAEPSVE